MSKKTSSRTSAGKAASFSPEMPDLTSPRLKPIQFKPLNDSQEKFLNKIDNHTLTFALGPAGTGKTMCAAARAAEYLKAKWIDRIIITRPVVEAGEKLGHLPGDLEEKFGPYVAPIMECLSKLLGKSHVEALVQNERIVFLPLAFARGWTFERSFVILDEAQNVSRAQMKLFLTRIGKDSTIVVDGDESQKDIEGVDGLDDAVRRLAGVRSVAVHKFTTDDIVRHGIVRDVIRAYSDEPSEDDKGGLTRYLNK